MGVSLFAALSVFCALDETIKLRVLLGYEASIAGSLKFRRVLRFLLCDLRSSIEEHRFA